MRKHSVSCDNWLLAGHKATWLTWLKSFGVCLVCLLKLCNVFRCQGWPCLCVFVTVQWHTSVGLRLIPPPTSIFTSPLSEINPGVFCKCLCGSIATSLHLDLLGFTRTGLSTLSVHFLDSLPSRLSNHLDNRMQRNRYDSLRGKSVTSVIRETPTCGISGGSAKQFGGLTWGSR